MDEIRYIHAADLHLDTPFRGLSKEAASGSHLAHYLQQAPFTALEKLVRLCESEKPDFLLISGDVYNQEDCSIKAQLSLRDACQRLERAGIKVFIAHGNHDPLSSTLQSIEWPQNTTIFGPDVESYIFEKDGAACAIIHGISHARDKEVRNLAQQFKRDERHNCLQIGVLHCTISDVMPDDGCATCSLEDLINTGLDAWALGHIHEHKILLNNPFIAYSGNTQGLHINEPGHRGCFLIKAKREDNKWSFEPAFKPLGPIQWEKIDIDLEDSDTLDELERRLNNEIDKIRASAGVFLDGMIVRLNLKGRTNLDAQLRKPGALKDIAEIFNHYGDSHPAVWVKDIELSTTDLTSKSDYLSRDDLLGETMRLANKLLEDEASLDDFADAALQPLTSNPRFRKAIVPFDSEQKLNIIRQAERICQEALEDR